MAENPIVKVDIGTLAEPATALIERVSDAVGGIAKPWQITRVAKAEAKAEIIRVENEIEIEGLRIRAAKRFLHEQMFMQSNLEKTVYAAPAYLDPQIARPDLVSEDWIFNWAEKAKMTSDAYMRELWAKVLAREANALGSSSRRTVNLMANMDRHDGSLFTRLCGFVWQINEEYTLLTFRENGDSYEDHGINNEAISILIELGLIRPSDSFFAPELPIRERKCVATYHGERVELEFPHEDRSFLYIWKCHLTQSGLELLPICDAEPVDGYFDYVCGQWATMGLLKR